MSVSAGYLGVFFHLQDKMQRLRQGDRRAFVDAQGYRKFVAETRDAFEAQLRAQLSGPPGAGAHRQESSADRAH